MVYPKPGLSYSYKFRVPDHLRRKKVQTKRDPTKIYEHLSDADLFDITGIGLKMLDFEEIYRFDKEKAEAEAFEKSLANSKTAAGKINKPTSRKPKAVFVQKLDHKRAGKKTDNKHVKVREIAIPISKKKAVKKGETFKAETDFIKKETKAMAKKKQSIPTEHVQAESVVDVIKEEDQPCTSKSSTKRAKSGKKLQNTESLTKTKITKVGKVHRTSMASTGSSSRKRNCSKKCDIEEEYSEAPKLFPMTDRNEDAMLPPVLSSFADSYPWRSSWPVEVKQEVVSDGECDAQSTKRMNKGKVEVLLSSLDYMKETWPVVNSPKNESKKTKLKDEESDEPPTLFGPFITKVEGGEQSTKGNEENHPDLTTELANSKSTEVVKVKSSKKCVKKTSKLNKTLTLPQLRRRTRHIIENHFKRMPGTRYSCPSRNLSPFVWYNNGNKSRIIYICLVCHRDDFQNHGNVMICCDKCENWYHLSCVGVRNEEYPVYLNWYCKRCMDSAIYSADFDPKSFPLYVKKITFK